MQRRKIPPCPYCGKKEVYRHGKNKQRRVRYKCRLCKKTFCNRTGTTRLHSHISDRQWEESIRLFALRGAVSGADLARFLEVERKTGQRIMRKIRKQTSRLPEAKLNGTVEADETTLTRTWIWGAVSRDTDKLVLRRVSKRDEKTLISLITEHTEKNSILFTDEWRGYCNLWNRRKHFTVTHSREFVSEFCKEVHTNKQEGVWGLIKPIAIHTYRGIPREKLDEYLKEFTFRYNLKDYKIRVKVLKSYFSKNFHTLWV